MAKIVRYNGGTESYYKCSEPTKLVIGKNYEVVHETDLGCQTNLLLKEVSGSFNSVWFDEIEYNQYVAISNEIPILGKRYKCAIVRLVAENPTLLGRNTSIVKEVTFLGNCIYKVTTYNSIYYVYVG